MAKLSPEQKTQIEQWAADGASLNDIQQRMKADMGLSVTYLDARMMLVELGIKLVEKPKEVPKEAPPAAAAPEQFAAERDVGADFPAAGAGRVSVTVDELAIEGAMVSGRATFSDGKTAAWFVDQSGRLGLKAAEPGYQPPPADIPIFQTELDRVLIEQGF